MRWLPGETLFSLTSRFHFLSGRVRSADTSRLLFGTHRGGFPPAIPGHLTHFADAFRQSLGTAREVVTTHTVLPQLLATRTQAMQEAIYRAAEQGPTGNLKAKLGLLASRFGGLLPLKACRSCIEEDVPRHGTGIWYTEHLLTGVWICRRHGEPLEILASMKTGQSRYEWSLPRADLLASATKEPWIPTGVILTSLKDLAGASTWLFDQGKRGGIDLHCFTNMLWARLVETGYARDHGRLRQVTASKAFSDCFHRLRELPELSRIASTPTIAYSQLLTVLRGGASGLHPLRVASVLAWLYPGSTHYSEEYVARRSAVINTNPISAKSKQENGSGTRADLVARVMAGESVSSAARAVGVEVVTGQAWVTAVGIAVPVRPSVLTGDYRQRIVAALRSGSDKASVERRFGISGSSVNRLLRTEVGLYAAWKEIRESACRSKMRSSWLDQISVTGTGPKYARHLAPAAYAWLYRNDREWLRQANLDVEVKPKTNNACTDWDRRDRNLSQEVLNAALEINDLCKAPIRLVDILARVPELKSKMPKLNRLPLTSRALDQVLRFSRRRKA